MGDVVIRAEDLGKRYRIGAEVLRPTNTREAMGRFLGAPARHLRALALPASEAEIVWALRGASFEVRQGEVLGVIGRNGAGKSTLLKILSRITEPTEGRAVLHGRVASLLEVGTGFHAELSGRENVYMNGAILGMRRAEIDAKFEEIVAFSGVGKFIDTPVKRYSSGMYLRLAFAVAAHLDPDVLIVDEILAVGDIEFQKKCLGKMREVTEGGRTALFVSHNMAMVKSLAHRAILLDGGRIVREGPVHEVVDAYLKGVEAPLGAEFPGEGPVRGTGEARIRRVELLDRFGRPRSQLYFGEPFRVVLTVEARKAVPDAVAEVGISSLDGTRATTSFSIDGERPPYGLAPGVHRIAVDLDPHLLPGQYAFDLGVHHTGPPWTMHYLERTLPFEVLNVAAESGDRYPYDVHRGFVRPPARWAVEDRPAPVAPISRQPS